MNLRIGTIVMLAGAALLLAGCDKKPSESPPIVGNVEGVTAPAGSDWTEKVIETAQGGYLLGNPNAPVRLVEYASLTCPHCSEFSRQASGPLRENYVKSGKVSWEFRPFALNAIDVSASLLAMCQGPAPFFKLIEQTYLEQEKWILPYQKFDQAVQQKLSALPQGQQFVGLAREGGLDTFFRVRGLPSAKGEACLTDQKMIDRILAIRERGVKEDDVQGTPTFLINGVKVEQPPSWSGLEPELKKALGA